MNTKQKLTLGIAAIFMVTLTIVGVTYAYFVTQVTGNTTESVRVQTANIGIKYGAGSGEEVELTDVLPGKTYYKSFTVINDLSEAPVMYSVGIQAKYSAKSDIRFISSAEGTDVAATCYAADSVTNRDSADEAKKALVADCYTGAAYDNIVVSLWEYTGASDVSTLDEAGVKSLVDANTDMTAIGNLATKVNKATDVDYKDIQVLSGSEQIAGMADATDASTAVKKQYLVKIEYVDAKANQNIETQASVKLRLNIALPQ